MVSKKKMNSGKPIDFMMYEGLRALEEKIWVDMESSIMDVNDAILSPQSELGQDVKAFKQRVKLVQQSLAKITKSKKALMNDMRHFEKMARDCIDPPRSPRPEESLSTPPTPPPPAPEAGACSPHQD